MQSEKIDELKCIEAHENEILSIDYAEQHFGKKQKLSVSSNKDKANFLVSGSRDTLIQIYDTSNDYEPIQIIEEHQSTVTTVKFVKQKDQGEGASIALLTGGADKQINKFVFNEGQKVNDFEPFKQVEKITQDNKIFSMDVAHNMKSGK